MAMKGQMETELRQARGTDFADCPTDFVGIGSVVELQAGKETLVYTILGAWDGNPDKNILSYKTPMAQALMGKKVGEKVSAAGQDYTILSMKRWMDGKK
jgi:transcription elongation GreA/GreB family factor